MRDDQAMVDRRNRNGLGAISRHGVFLLLWLAIASVVAAKEVVNVDDWTLTICTSADGLPSNVVRGLAQTPDGFLWIATFGGLSRFDGDRFVNFDAVNAPQLGSSRFWGLLVDRRGTLWIANNDGVVSTYREGRFSRVHECSVGNIRSIVEDHTGNVWIGGSCGTWRYINGAFQLVSEYPAWNLWVDKNHDVWGGGQDGIYRIHEDVATLVYDAKSRELAILPLPDGDGVANVGDQLVRLGDGRTLAHSASVALRAGILDRQQSCWWATASGVYRIPASDLRHETFQIESRHHVLPAEFRVRAVMEDRDGTIWLGSESKGLILLQRRYQRSLGHRDAVVPIEDGSYWALQPDRLEADRLRDGSVVEHLPLADVHRISRAQRGGLWVLCGSADQPQLVRYAAGQTETHPWPKALRHDIPVHEDTVGRLWQSTTC